MCVCVCVYVYINSIGNSYSQRTNFSTLFANKI